MLGLLVLGNLGRFTIRDALLSIAVIVGTTDIISWTSTVFYVFFFGLYDVLKEVWSLTSLRLVWRPTSQSVSTQY